MSNSIKITKVRIALDNAPDSAAALGRLLGHWAFLENLLIGVVQYLLQVKPYIAATIYDEFISFSAKIKLLKRINHHFNQNAIIKNELNSILIAAEELNRKRNSFIHASWASGKENMLRFENILPANYKKIRKTPQKFTPQDIQNVVEEIAELSASLGTLLSRILTDNITDTLV